MTKKKGSVYFRFSYFSVYLTLHQIPYEIVLYQISIALGHTFFNINIHTNIICLACTLYTSTTYNIGYYNI
jgi:hypothetical protein